MCEYQIGKDIARLEDRLECCCSRNLVKSKKYVGDNSKLVFTFPVDSHLVFVSCDRFVSTPDSEYTYSETDGTVTFEAAPATGVPIIIFFQ